MHTFNRATTFPYPAAVTMFPAPPIPSSHESEPSRFAGLRPGPIGKILACAAALVAVALAAWDIVDIATQETLTFTYVARSGKGFMDQQLLIGNDGGNAVTPFLSFAALNGAGERLPGVTVRTVYGSDHGGLVVLPGGGSDVLIFDGPFADQVADVKVTVEGAPVVRFPSVRSEVEVTPVDGQGLSTTRDSRFAAVELTNTNDVPVTVRLIYVVWSNPGPGQTQQAETVTPLGNPIEVPGDGSVTVPMAGLAHDANAAAVAENRSASIKAYFATA